MKKEFLILTVLSVTFVLVYFLFPDLQGELKYNKKSDDSDKFSEVLNKDHNNYENLDGSLLSFDLVRVSRKGDVIMAGKSEPNRKIQLLDGQEVLSTFQSDANGEWIWLSENPLKNGIKKFKLRYYGHEYTEESDQTIIVLIDNSKNSKPKIAKFFNNENDKIDMLDLDKIADGIILDFVNYSLPDNVILSGRTLPNNNVILTIRDKIIEEVESDDDGKWKMILKMSNYQNQNISIETNINGEEVVLTYSSSELNKKLKNKVISLTINQFVVEQGNSLWRIARKTLGGGIFYTEIYKNNSQKIKNPDLIFPGQVFNIPTNRKKVFYE